MEDRIGAVVVLTDLDSGLDEMRPQRAFGDLQFQPVEGDAIVVADLALFLEAEDLGEIDAGDRDESHAFLLGLDGETRIMGGDVDVPDKGVGGLDRGDPGERQLLRQAVLQGLEDAFRTASGLRRIGRDMFDAQMLEGASDLGRTGPIDLAAGLRCMKIMAAAVRIEAQGQAMVAKNLFQGPERRSGAFLLDQKGRKNSARRIVQRDDQIERLVVLKPRKARPILMQHHAQHRAPRPLAPVGAPPRGFRQQAPVLQIGLGPRVAPVEAMILHQMLVEMLGRKAGVAAAVKRLNLGLSRRRNPSARDLAKPPVQQASLSFDLKTIAPAPKRPLANPQQLARFQLTKLRRLVTSQNVQKLNHPHTLKGFRPAHPKPSKGSGIYRTDRALPKPAISSATDNSDKGFASHPSRRYKPARAFFPTPLEAWARVPPKGWPQDFKQRTDIMAEIKQLAATVRSGTGKGAARSVRREGRIPGVIYGGGEAPQPIALDHKQTQSAIFAGRFLTTIFEIDVAGRKERVIPRDFQLDVVKDTPLHVDFLRLKAGSRLRVEVPVHFINQDQCPGLKRGGTLNIVRHTVEMTVPVDAIPESITGDLAGLDINDSLHISAFKLPEGCKPTITGRDFTVATIAPPTTYKEETPAAATATTAAAVPAAGASAAPAAAGAPAKDAKAAPAAKAVPAAKDTKK